MEEEMDIYEMEYFDLSYDKKRRKKRFIIFITVFVVLFIGGVWLSIRPGIVVDDEFYLNKGNGVYVSEENRVEVTRKDGNEVVVEGCLNGKTFLTRLTWEDVHKDSVYEAKKITIRFNGNIYTGTWSTLSWEDFSRISWDFEEMYIERMDTPTMQFFINNYDDAAYLTCAIVFGKQGCDIDSNIKGFLFSCLLYIIGVVMYKMPDELYELLTKPWGYNSDANVQFGTVVKYIKAYALVIIGGISMSMAIFRLML